MEWKKLIIWTSIIMMLFAAIAVSGFWTYFNRPHWIGIENELADSLKRIDSIEYVEKQLRKQNEAFKKQQEQLRKDTTKRPPVPLTDVKLDNFINISPAQLNYLEIELYNKSMEINNLNIAKNNLQNEKKK